MRIDEKVKTDISQYFDTLILEKADWIEPNLENIKNTVLRILDNKLTADVAEVRHGEWEKDTDKVRDDGEIYDYRCSLCKGEAHEGEYGNNDVLADFCHHCGAKMDGGNK